ncbi:hypothetical protein MYX06_00200 [Patescibacteria group bacterium AH-259-L05]|nr:hypothetical protein [Patescibacteria group bacterium AH-259-L05]
MRIQFISNIRRANKSGTGFLYIPKSQIGFFSLGDWIKVKLLEDIYFFAKLISYSSRRGVYIPQHIMRENDLLNRKIKITVEKVDGFYAKMYLDGRIYIPKDIIEGQKLKPNDIILIQGIESHRIVQERYSKIHVTKRNNRAPEYTCIFDKAFYAKEILFRIKKQSQEADGEKLNSLVAQLLKGMHYAFINRNSFIVFKGNKIPAVMNSNLKYPGLAFYLGAYFADGTKKGNSWAICASTFEQAKYYLKMHNLLIKNSRPEFTISYTNIHKIDNNQLKKNLVEVWGNNAGIKVNKFRIREPEGKLVAKWNQYGTLIIREHRQILLDLYNALLKLLIKEILSKENKKLALDFICGVMEGDGCASATKRGHVMIFTNKKEIFILRDILKKAQIKFKVNRSGENGYMLRIGALEILKNFYLLKEQIFILYPKRRKALFERLKTVGAVKFLVGDHKPASWIKAWLRDNGFCDRTYRITPDGAKLRSELISNINTTGPVEFKN